MQLVESKRSSSSFVVRDCREKASADANSTDQERAAGEVSGDESVLAPVSIAADAHHAQDDGPQAGNGQSESGNERHDTPSFAPPEASAESDSPAATTAKISPTIEAAGDAPTQATAATSTAESPAANNKRSPRKRHKKGKRGRRGQRNKSADAQSSPQNSRPKSES
jgi:hypothetical protein